MNIFQWDQNPWGQEILVRISWDLFYLSVLGGALFIVGHLVYRRKHPSDASNTLESTTIENIPEKIVRHSLPARLFHWIMAGSVLVLLGTGFLPVLCIHFDWVAIHWIAGLVLIGSIIFHVIHTVFWLNWRDIWISSKDWSEWKAEVREIINGTETPSKSAKYPVDHRIFHNMIALTAFGVMATGLLMMFRIDGTIFARNSYMLSENSWGWVYVIHGLSAVGFVGMVMTHIYFAILPEKRWMTISMILGWITRKDYIANHDPERWVVGKESSK